MSPVVDRLPAPVGFPDGLGRADYADAFELRTVADDVRTAEQWARSALEQAPWAVRWLVIIAHRGVLRLRLGRPSSADHVLGWEIRRSEADRVELAADGPLVRAFIVGRRPSPETVRIETFVYFRRPQVAGAIWTIVGPLHRRIAPLLLSRAAAAED